MLSDVKRFGNVWWCSEPTPWLYADAPNIQVGGGAYRAQNWGMSEKKEDILNI